MIFIAKKFARKIGIDKAVFYTAFARVFQGFGGIISVLLVSTFLTGVEQGFYYTFASILAIQIFFELGLGSIITQFVAHEKAHLVEENNKLHGDSKYLSRLAYLLQFCIKWYSVLAIIIFVVLSIVGIIFFSYFYKSDVAVSWQTPWLLLVFGTVINFIITPIAAFLEGMNKVKDIAKIRLIQQLCGQIAIWSGLIGGLKLYVAAFGPFLSGIIFILIVWRKFGPLLWNIYHYKIRERISYMKEIFPFQWRIALSWVSGYFIFQFFNPVLFATEGAVVAGQMGMTLTVLMSILNLTASWINTKVPAFSALIAKKDYLSLDSIFKITLKQSVFVNVFGLLVMIGGIYLLRHFGITLNGKMLGDRFLPYLPLILMAITIVFNQYISSWATYLRCHKKEPMLAQSVTMGVLCSLSTIFLGKYFGVLGMTTGYAVLTLCGFIWTYFIYTINKKKWHNE